MPPPPGCARIAESGGGPETRLTGILIRQVGEKRAAGVLDEETREFGARLVLRPDDMAGGRGTEVLRGPHDEPCHPFQKSISFFECEGELAARTAARQFSCHREPGRPDDEESDEAADDQEVREADLVELAMVPEARDQDEGEEKQEEGPDREGAKTSVHTSPDRSGDLEPPVFEEQRVVVAVLVHAPHLHALHPTLICRLRDRL